MNQTVAGAIATGSHGSSLTHGSMSSHVLAVRAVLANGTVVEISQESHPFLMKAFKINVGRLGVVTDVKLRISPERLARRILKSAVPDDILVEMLRNAHKTYEETGSFPEWIEGAAIIWLSTNSTVSFVCILDASMLILIHPSRRYILSKYWMTQTEAKS